MKVTPRARSRDDRAGDPLDGLVNLFDLGMVLSVAFLLAALSSLHLTSTLTGKAKEKSPQGRAADAVVANRDQSVRSEVATRAAGGRPRRAPRHRLPPRRRQDGDREVAPN